VSDDAAVPATMWEGRSVDDWRRTLRLPALHVFDSIGSSNDAARALADEGAPAGTLVLAEHQQHGRGRQGRRWDAAPGSSLMMSFVLRPARSSTATGTLPLRIGIALAARLRDAVHVDARVKWPNDVVLANGMKLAGILCEGVAAGSSDGFVIAGIGINVHQQRDDWPVTLRDVATSIDAASAARTDRGMLLAHLVDALRPLFDGTVTTFAPAERAQFEHLDALRGRDVVATGVDGSATGTADGIEPDGALRLRTKSGLITRITSGTVRIATSTEPSRA